MACITPFYVDNPLYPLRSVERQVPVPCGKCPECLKRRSNHWSFRLQQHEKICKNALFVTLTYNTDHVPISSNGFMTLCKRDFQLFVKRLRKAHVVSNLKDKISYYAVGEYGSDRMRPHYHAIMFNVEPSLLDDAWMLGIVDIGTVTGASISYTTKYLHKGKCVPVHSRDDRVPEFSLMSKKLGLNYLSEAVVSWHRANIERNYVIIDNGVKVSMPRYFRERVFTEEERSKQAKFVERLSKEKLDAVELEYFNEHGSMIGFDRMVYEGKKAYLVNFKDDAISKRSKL